MPRVVADVVDSRHSDPCFLETEKVYEVPGCAPGIVNRLRSGIGQLPAGTRAANQGLLVAYAQEMFRDEATRSAARLAGQTSA